jgi:O-antigen/teichoic acid export membrane protein
MLWILVLQAAVSRIGSKLAAERPYGWAWDPGVARRILTFGWPLIVNGLLMCVIFDGDRFVIGSAKRLFQRSPYTLADLGVYSVAFALTMAPTMITANIGTSLLLPMLSKVQGSPSEFEKRYSYCSQTLSLVAGLIAIPFIVAGAWFVILIYGAKYAATASFIGWLAVMWALRIVRVAPTVAAMARSDTRNTMVSNIARTLALPGVLLAAATGSGIVWIAISGFVGELLALGVCLWRLQREHNLSASIFLKPFAVSAIGMGFGGTVAVTLTPHLGWFFSFFVATGLMLFQLLSMLLVFPGLRRQVVEMIFNTEAALGTVKEPA